MAKVTYLIGAGASFDALPIVANFAKEIGNIITKVSAARGTMSNKDHRTLCTDIISDLKFLHEGCENHMSVDTFCKMLYLTERQEDYKRAKYTIIIFFDLYRHFHRKYDKRYDAFLATILKKDKPRFPDNINIISWNYDCEFEKAFRNYSHPRISMEEVYGELNVVHKNSKNINGLNNKFGIIKVNGTIGFYKNNVPHLGLNTWDVYSSGQQHSFIPIIESYEKNVVIDRLEPMISFAWDDDYGERKIEQEIIEALAKTEILVIIGYSFPYFNREKDKHILKNIGNRFGHVPKKIYVQDKDPHRLKENIEALKPDNTQVFFINNVDQFYIPHELD